MHNYEIDRQIETVADRYDIIMSNSFLRKSLAKIVIPHEFQNGKDILLSRSENYRLNGYMFNELYRGILGMAMWVYRARTEVLPELKYHLSDGNISPSDRVREQMALENINSNLGILTDELNNLYVHTVEADKASHKLKPPVYQRTPELENLGQLLTSDMRGLMI